MEKRNLLPAQQTHVHLLTACKPIAKELVRVNHLVGFPMSGEDIQEWSIQLYELVPNLDTSRLHFLLNEFAMDHIEWDKNKGIQNIFNGLKRVYLDDNGKLKLSKLG
jgi:hypothetical protein